MSSVRSRVKSTSICLSLTLGFYPLYAQQAPLETGLMLGTAEASFLGFSTQGAGARATGMGGAFIGVADDATASSYNPAGLAQLRTFETSLVLTQRKADVLYTDVSGSPYPDGESGVTYSDSPFRGKSARKIEFASFTMPGEWSGKNFAFQLSYQNLYDLDQNFENGFESAASQQSIHQSGGMKVWTLGAALELSPRLLAGISLNQWKGDWTYISDFQSLIAPGQFRMHHRFSGSNVNAGLLWRYEPIQIGMTYRSAFTANVDADATVTLDDDPSLYASRYRVHWPSTLGVGASWRPGSEWLFALDWSRTRWSNATMEAPGQTTDGQNFFQPIGHEYPALPCPGSADAEAWHVGGEYLFFLGSKVVPLRVGGFIEPMPSRDSVTGEVRKLKGFTLGTGIKSGNLSLDVAYKCSKGTRRATVPVSPLIYDMVSQGDPADVSMIYRFVGTESITIQTFKCSVIYQFKGEALRGFLRDVFIGN